MACIGRMRRRRVRFMGRWTDRINATANVFGWAVLVVLFVVAVGVSALFTLVVLPESVLLLRNGESATGIVVSDIEVSCSQEDCSYVAQVRFVARGGELRTVRMGVGKGKAPGDILEVRYLPGDEDVVTKDGTIGLVATGVAAFLLGPVLFVGLVGFAVWFATRRLRLRPTLLLRRGNGDRREDG